MPEFAPSIDLSALNGANGFAIDGEAPFDSSGSSVAAAGDVNGDGFADFIIGAPGSDANGNISGSSYVVFGHAGGFGEINPSSLDGSNGFAINGEVDDNSGRSVSGAGDVNGDGLADLIVGAAGAGDSGASYVVFGAASGLGANFDVSSLDGANGFRINGEAPGDVSGSSVSSAGDVNRDGFDDLVIGAPFADGGGNASGATYVVFGKAGGFASEIDLSALTPGEGFIIDGRGNSNRSGSSVASAGDVNGDGFGDIVIGAPYAGPGGNHAGASYVVFGQAGGFTNINLTALNGSNGFRILGEAENHFSGGSVASAGDINADGFDDLIVGADGANAGRGAAYVVFGKAFGFGPDLSLSALDGTNGFAIDGEAAGNYAGFSVSSAGDVNGDGYDDLIIGAPGASPSGASSGAAYVVFGKAGGFGNIDLGGIDGSNGFAINGEQAGGVAGGSVSAAGDINNDGFADLIVGARGVNGPAGADSGGAYVIFGHRAQAAVTRIGTDTGQTINGGVGDDFIDGRGGNDTLKGWEGVDTLLGGLGNDTYVLEDIHGPDGPPFPVEKQYDAVVEAADEGIDTVRILALDNRPNFGQLGRDGYQLTANVENGVITGTRDFSLSGNDLNNVLAGNSANNGLIGFEGNDRLNGGLGGDLLAGGIGNDAYILADVSGLGADFDVVIEAPGEGVDRVIVKAIDNNFDGPDGYSLADNVEIGQIVGTHAFFLTGTATANRLFGGAGSNTLRGLGGNDFLTGGLGRDVLKGAAGHDTFDFNAVSEASPLADQRDVITDFTHFVDTIDLSTIDAVPGGGEDAFLYRGTSGFTDVGQIRLVQSGADTIVLINTAATPGAEASILLTGVTAATLTAADFIL